jgi:hypothetical protein
MRSALTILLAVVLMYAGPAFPQACPKISNPQTYVKFSCPAFTPSETYCQALNSFEESQRTGSTLYGGVALAHCDLDLSSPANDPGNILYLDAAPDQLLGPAAIPAAVGQSAASYLSAWVAWEAARLDKQLGAPSSASGASSLVAKPGTSGLLALAVESGSFTETNSGTAITLSANAGGLDQLITSGNPIQPACSGNCNSFLRNMGIDLAFTAAQTGSSSISTSGQATTTSSSQITSVLVPTSSAKFSSVDVTYNFYSVNPGSKGFNDKYATVLQKNAAQLATIANSFTNAYAKLVASTKDNVTKGACAKYPGLTPFAVYQTLRNKYMAKFIADAAIEPQSKASSSLIQDFNDYERAYLALMQCADLSDFNTLVVNSTEALETYATFNQSLINQARGTPLLAIKYLYSRPANQPDTHDFSVIFSYGWTSGTQLTFNGAGSIYGAGRPSNANYDRVHDAQLSAELDKTFGSTSNPPAVLSLAGYGQYQPSASVLSINASNLAPNTDITLPANGTQVLVGTAGWLGIVQGKLTLNLAKSISIPLAVKWSNKTELLADTDWRGQIGISYDFSSLVNAIGK